MSSSDTESEDSEPRETLIAGREKRSTAGNRLGHLLQHLDDEDIKADLLAEDEDDQADYSASDDGQDGDAGFDSSDDDDDDAANNHDSTNLQGEAELKRQERAETSKKRKARDLVRIQPMQKRVRVNDGPIVPKARKDTSRSHKSNIERVTSLQANDSASLRQSSRTQTVASAKVTEEKLKDHYKRALKAQELMRLTAEKKAADAVPALTQADRMARALEIEEENSHSLTRWTHGEQERRRLQQEKLEAMRNRKLEGPIIRYWSGPVLWTWRQGPDGPLYERMSYQTETRPVAEVEEPEQEMHAANVDMTTGDDTASATPRADNATVKVIDEVAGNAEPTQEVKNPESNGNTAQVDINAHSDTPMLDGIHSYITRDPDVGLTDSTPMTRSATEQSIAESDAIPSNAGHVDAEHPLPSMPPYIHIPVMLARLAPMQDSAQSPTVESRLPLMTQTAARTLLTLESFDILDAIAAPTTSRRTGSAVPSSLASQAITSMLLPDSQPNFSAEERRYLTTKMKAPPKSRESLGVKYHVKKAEDLLPPPPAKQTCLITGKTARYRDPSTGLVYHDMAAARAIERIMAGGTHWSGLLGAWSGIVGEGALGRVAVGVPKDFWTGATPETQSDTIEPSREVVAS